jgi:hypothetical protein
VLFSTGAFLLLVPFDTVPFLGAFLTLCLFSVLFDIKGEISYLVSQAAELFLFILIS